jgi:hypothetical protein
MPYPNEHAARVRDPGNFEPTSFRSKELKPGIGVRIIIAKLKDGNDSMIVQAYRFSIDKFTVDQAKKWLEDNKIKYISFVAATPESETGGNVEDKVAHSGVLGMKWGQRNSRTIIVNQRNKRRTPGKSSKKKSDDFDEVAKLKKKKIYEMSNEEIARITKRMDLEKRYKDLNPSRIDMGKKTVRGIFSTIGTIAGTAGSIAALARIGSALYRRINAAL